jgi:hypothetical protein
MFENKGEMPEGEAMKQEDLKEKNWKVFESKVFGKNLKLVFQTASKEILQCKKNRSKNPMPFLTLSKRQGNIFQLKTWPLGHLEPKMKNSKD